VGTQGVQGAVGTGAQGAPGVQGAQGVQGSDGIGTQGAVGAQGAQGVQGAVGTGAQGAPGVQGAQGVQGAIGAGAQGAQGVQGSIGPAGLSFTSSVNVSSNTTAATQTLYILTANVTLTLPATPTNFDYVGVTNLSGFANSYVARNGEKIMSITEDLTIDVVNGGFTLFYSGSSAGWIIL
jgi:hypothetical protein